MPRTQINALSVTRAGIAPMAGAATDVANGNYIVNDGRLFLRVRNTDVSTRNLTINLTTQVDGQDVEPRAYAIAASATRLIGPFPTSEYGAQLQLNSDNAAITVEAYYLPNA